MVGSILGIGSIPAQQNNEKNTNRCFQMPHYNKSIHLQMDRFAIFRNSELMFLRYSVNYIRRKYLFSRNARFNQSKST